MQIDLERSEMEALLKAAAGARAIVAGLTARAEYEQEPYFVACRKLEAALAAAPTEEEGQP